MLPPSVTAKAETHHFQGAQVHQIEYSGSDVSAPAVFACNTPLAPSYQWLRAPSKLHSLGMTYIKPGAQRGDSGPSGRHP